MNDVQRRDRERSDAISTALADVDKGQFGLRHHRWVLTVEYVPFGADGWTPAHHVDWCWDCGRIRAEAEQVPTPSALYDDHPALGFCGYRAKQPSR